MAKIRREIPSAAKWRNGSADATHQNGIVAFVPPYEFQGKELKAQLFNASE
jgi:hypothetical protein